MFSLPTVALSIFPEILVENWSFPDHKSDFKADQKIRKAMFSAEERSFRGSRRRFEKGPDFSLPVTRGQRFLFYS